MLADAGSACLMAHLTVLIDTLFALRQCLVDACNAAESRHRISKP